MAQYVDCKKGLHSYSLPSEIGGGISRRTCSGCRVVQIDLGAEPGLSDTSLFTHPKLATMFEVEAILARVGENHQPLSRSFGERPAGRRRPVQAFQ